MPDDHALDAAVLAGDHPFEVELHERIGSTNDRARELAAAGRRDVAVVAAEQTAGRGRRDRSWAGPPGGLYLSAVVAPSLSPPDYPLVTLAAGVAVVRAIETVTAGRGDLAPRVKWPNDVLLAGGKVAGVLTERVDDAAVVGVGANVDVDPERLPDGAASVAGALAEREATVRDGDRERIARESLATLADLLGAPEEVVPAWRSVADTLGRRVRVDTPGGSVVGEAVDVERPGRLVVRTEAGRTRVDAGDCEHLRPTE